ncbi:MAG TPA: adenine phosphoribosyltransferase [Phycisphaerae bacterium]|nr:adenine phosphoribosyltransferase [Phycisphaerae bacterium]HPS52582.1 adenine phosphoribosyltransferase [Phycisphaerae bacterium]
MSKVDIASYIRDVRDFPKPGIVFKDITPLLCSHAALDETVSLLLSPFANEKIDLVCGIESRGFIFGSLIANRLGVGFVPIRKAGKLPAETLEESYELEYGRATIEIHTDAVKPGQRVLMVDDLLATGGTMAAACRLVERLGGEVVGCPFVIELTFIPGRKALAKYRVHSLLKVTGE